MTNLGSLAADYATSSSDEDSANNMKQKGSTIPGAYVKRNQTNLKSLPTLRSGSKYDVFVNIDGLGTYNVKLTKKF